jgi:sarcosine oxidase
MGSATAYHFARNGQKTLLLEQFQLDHKWGSSHCFSRIIRYAYDHPAYIAMARAVYPMWQALSEEVGEPLIQITGGLDFGRLSHQQFADTRQAMLDMHIPFEELSPAEVRYRYPQFQLDDDMVALFQADAGLVRPSASVIHHTRRAQALGAEFIEENPVLSITVHPDSVTVHTEKGVFSAAKLVIAAGSWAGPLLQTLGLNLPLQPTRQPIYLFQADEAYRAGPMPIYIGWGEATFYGIGSWGDSGFKCARHGDGQPVTPETVDRVPDAQSESEVRAFLGRHIPAMAQRPLVEGRVCLYTMTPDEHFILDTHPTHPHIAFGAGFSGHGFKFATLIGKILVDLANKTPIDLDLSLFRVERFLH